jgi:hypothetical protein
MKFPLPYNTVQIVPTDISGTLVLGDISGVPSIAVGKEYGVINFVYFAISVVGGVTLPDFPPYEFSTPTIIAGVWRPDGSLGNPKAGPLFGRGLSVLPNTLTTTTGDTQPTVAIGPNNELYVAFVTNGSMPNRYNMSDIPSFCPTPSPGISDIVVTQSYIEDSMSAISVAVLTNWWIQDASINSTNNESNPQICCDRTNRFLYMVHQSEGNILCFPVIGTGPNVILSCITLTDNTVNPPIGTTGAVVWREAQADINCDGATTNPAIATDQNGGVYVAVEINGPIQGGAFPTATQVIDVIKFKNYSVTPYTPTQDSTFQIPPGIFTSMSRSYVLSGIDSSIFPEDGTSSKPSIACDPVSGTVVLGFTTTGTMPGQARSSFVNVGGGDVVLVTFKSDGTLLTVLQGDMWSPAFNPYTSARDVSLTSDNAGNIFMTYIITTASNTECVLAYQLYPTTGGQLWNYQEPGGINYTAYAYAMTGAPNTIFNTAPLGSFTKTPMGSFANQYFIATSSTQTPIGGIAPVQHGLQMTGYESALYTFDNTVFNYMSRSKSICACGTTNCGCS